MPIQSSEAYSFNLGYELALKDSKNRFENVLATSGKLSPTVRESLTWHRDSIERALADTQADLEAYRERGRR